MPLAAIVLGAVIIDLALRGTEHEFSSQLGKDFGSGSTFYSWVAAITILGTAGYVRALKPFTDPLLALVIVVIALRNGGLWSQLAQLAESPPPAAAGVSLSTYPAPTFNTGGGSSSGGSGGTSGASDVVGGGSDFSEIAALAAFA